jgi:alkaline phosphatase D
LFTFTAVANDYPHQPKLKFMKKLVSLFLYVVTISAFSQVERVVTLNPALRPFYHGVASGDPLSDRVIIWTRVTPDSNWVGSADVLWRVATDTGMTNIVQSGVYTTDQTKDYTVKIDVTGLQPNTFYFYEFTHLGYNSIRGRTKTAPVGSVDSLRFAVVSCANYEAGFFNAYKVITARNDVDAIIHLGDYIYEYVHDGYAYNATSNRIWEPVNEITMLSDYRTRYSTYHLDEDLMRLHQQFPFFNVWDDHESANDAYKDGAENHTEGTEGLWSNRKRYSRQAYFEWVPIRPQSAGNDSIIYRVISYGDLVDFIMLDTRIHGRDQQVAATSSAVNDTSRTILGDDQFDWLKQKMVSSTKQWKVLGQQVMIAPLEIFGTPVNADQWDGYAADRLKLINYVLDSNITDVVALTGDIHTSWANDVPTSTYQSDGTGSAFVEFVTTSVTSPGLPIPVPVALVQALNNHIKYANLTQKGFTILDINQQRTQTDWFFVNTVDQSDAGYTNGENWYVNDGERHLRQAAGPASPRPDVVFQQSPLWPRPFGIASVQKPENQIQMMGVYPNPVDDNLYFQLYLLHESTVELQLLDLNGKAIYNKSVGPLHNGLNNIVIPCESLAHGTYVLQASAQGFSTSLKVIKN